MALELNLKQEPVGTFESQFGKLYIFPLTVGAQRNMHKMLGKSFSEIDAESFVKALMGGICFFEKDLLEGKYRPDNSSSLTTEDIDKLSNSELENFAKTYVQSNEYLFKESKTKTKKNERGNSVLYQELGEEIHPRHDDETYVEYLLRLSIIEENKQKEQFAKLIKPFGAITGFSNTLTESIKNSLLMGDSLKKRMESIRPPSFTDIRPVESHFKQIDYGNIIAQQEKNRLAPFNNLSDKLDELIDSSVQVADFIVETNRIQAGISKELKDAGDHSVRFSKINIGVSCFIIFLTVCSLYMAYTASKSNNEQTIATRSATEKYADKIVNGLNGLSSAIVDNNAQTEQNTSMFVKEIEKLSNANVAQLQEIVTKQNKIIAEIKLMNDKNNERFRELEDQLKTQNK
jgi:hypothetical protein